MNAPALPASAADYIAHIDLAFELMVVLDASGRIVRANAAAGDILGYSPVELAGRPVRELLHPDERAAMDTLAADLLAGRPCHERELRWRRKDGATIYLSLSARWSAHARLVYASARDVTAHRAARDELKRSRERMHAMLESIGDAFFAIDREWRITYANRKAGAFIGVDVAPNVGRHLLEVAPALEGSAIVEHYRRALASGESGFFEAYWQPSATWVEVRCYPTPDGLSVYFHDVTAKRVALDAVRKSEQRFRNLFQQAGDSIVIADADLRIIAANGRACARFGYTEDEFSGLSVSDIDGHHAYTPGLLDSLRGGQTHLLRMAKRRKDGTSFPAEVHISRFEDGGEEYFQAIIRDLTEREEAERQLRASERRFREVIEMTPAGYVLASADGRVLDVNPALCALAG
ncbi:PAS domain S-box protein, partial [Massilia sp. CT11-108]|uniref:PAS domain S-box protein n=1 Tax=Massilia sp. CT11-108 TaxID=3393900 RepID=UPI0039A5EE72